MRAGQADVVQWFYERGEVSDLPWPTIAIRAVRKNQLVILQWLCQNGFDFNTFNKKSLPPVHATASCEIDFLEWLTDNGFNVNTRDGDGKRLGERGYKHLELANMVTLLLHLRYIPPMLNLSHLFNEFLCNPADCRLLPVHVAASSKIDSLEWLIDSGANINVCDSDCQLPVERAYKHSKFANMVLLISHGAYIPLTLELPPTLRELLSNDHVDCGLYRK